MFRMLNLQEKLLLGFAAVFFLLPLTLSGVILGGDASSYLIWCLLFVLFGLIFAPLAKRIFPGSPDGGWLYGMFLGLLLPALLIWTLAHTGLPVFSQVPIIVVLILAAILLFFVKPKEPFPEKNRSQTIWSQITLILAESGLFFTCFLFWTFLRTLKPEIYGLEKFMDYGFMMSLWRSPTLPAKDMWLAGSNINYYYFGQYLFTFMAKLSGIRPAVSYNLSIAASFALSFTLAFALIRDLLSGKTPEPPSAQASEEPQEEGTRRSIRKAFIPSISGLVGAALLTLAGNSHAFFYGNNEPGNFFVRFLERSGVNTGQLGNYYFSDSTRFIGYNPETADRTIHEFPYYSYLVADLHAHMINLSVVLLLLAVLYQLTLRIRFGPKSGPSKLGSKHAPSKPSAYKPDPSKPSAYKPDPSKPLDLGAHQPTLWTKYYPASRIDKGEIPYLLLLGLLLGVSAMANYWDFVIYFVVCAVTLVVTYIGRYGSLAKFTDFLLMAVQFVLVFVPFLFVKQPVWQLVFFFLATALSFLLYRFRPNAWTHAGLSSALLFTTTHLVALSFNLNFDPMAKSFALAQNHSGFYRLFILWFAHVSLGVLFLISFFYFKHKDGKLRRSTQQNFLVQICRQEPNHLFTAILVLCGFGLIIAPEIVYVRDIYEGSFSRANTMFKFTYQAFAMLSLAGGVTLGALLQRLVPLEAKAASTHTPPQQQEVDDATSLTLPKRYRGHRSDDRKWLPDAILPLVLTVLLLLIPFRYTGQLTSWYGPLTRERQQGLAGDLYLGTLYTQADDGQYYELSHRLNMITWFNENVPGQEVILEAYGDSYSDYNSVSAYTGLPTVLGWQTHEWLWRTSEKVSNAYGEIVLPLQEEIRDFYEARSPETMLTFLQKYHVSYIVVGELERIKFPEINEDRLKLLGDIVFQSGTDYILQVYPFAEG